MLSVGNRLIKTPFYLIQILELFTTATGRSVLTFLSLFVLVRNIVNVYISGIKMGDKLN